MRRHLDEGGIEREEAAAMVLAVERVTAAAETLAEEMLKMTRQSPGLALSGVTGSG